MWSALAWVAVLSYQCIVSASAQVLASLAGLTCKTLLSARYQDNSRHKWSNGAAPHYASFWDFSVQPAGSSPDCLHKPQGRTQRLDLFKSFAWISWFFVNLFCCSLKILSVCFCGSSLDDTSRPHCSVLHQSFKASRWYLPVKSFKIGLKQNFKLIILGMLDSVWIPLLLGQTQLKAHQ